MKKQGLLLEQATELISETMGSQVAEDFYALYEFDDDGGIINGARSVLLEFVGPKMTEKKLKILSDKS